MVFRENWTEMKSIVRNKMSRIQKDKYVVSSCLKIKICMYWAGSGVTKAER